MNSVAAERRVVHYRGQVQGVGFRFTARVIAGGFAVTGYVQNLADGRVRLVCEGTAAELDRFLAEVRAELGHHLTDEQIAVDAASQEFAEFFIRH
jgi:acylphosphatase